MTLNNSGDWYLLISEFTTFTINLFLESPRGGLSNRNSNCSAKPSSALKYKYLSFSENDCLGLDDFKI